MDSMSVFFLFAVIDLEIADTGCIPCKYAENCRLFEFVLQEYTKRLVGGFFYEDSSHF